MTTSEVEQFWRWFHEERERRRLSYRAIEQTVGHSNGRLHKRASALQPPTLENCRAIAEAFGAPLETVMRRAGLLPEAAERQGLAELNEYAQALSDEKLAVLVTVARALAYEQPVGSGDAPRFRVIGLPELPEQMYTAEDVDRFLEGLTPEERKELLRHWQRPRSRRPPEGRGRRSGQANG